MKKYYEFLIFSLILTTNNVFAQPANDNVCNAIEILVGSSPILYNNAEATMETNEVFAPATGCCQQNGWEGSTISNSMWFTFVAPASGEVSVSTCYGVSFDTKIAAYEAGDCGDFSSFNLLAANDNNYYEGCSNFYTSLIDLYDLVPDNIYYIQVDSYQINYGSYYKLSIDEGNILPPPTSSIKLVHNSADLALSNVDIRINGLFPTDLYGFEYGDNISFRQCTNYFNIPSLEPVTITINPSNSEDDSNPFLTFTQIFDPYTNTILILDGIYSSTGYNPNNIEKPLSLFSYSNALIYAPDNILFHHGSTDAPTIDINNIYPDNNVPVNDLQYSNFDGYDLFNSNAPVLQVTEADGITEIETYVASTVGINAQVIITSGFLNPADNSDGAAFGLWSLPPYSGPLSPLPTPGNIEYDDACNAVQINLDGAIQYFNSNGLTTEVNEPTPSYGCVGGLSWCDGTINNTFWGKFTAPSNGLTTLTTCGDSTDFATQIAVYSVENCTDFDTYTLIATSEYAQPLCNVNYNAASISLCGLIPGNIYYVQIDGDFATSGNFELSALDTASCFAKVQFIHNSADLSIDSIDVRVNGEFAQWLDGGGDYYYPIGNNITFRYATPFLRVPANQEVVITINPANSTDDSTPIKTKVYTFEEKSINVAIIDGIYSTVGYNPDYLQKPLDIYFYQQNLNSVLDSTEVLFHHGVTDIEAVDINESNLGLVVNDLEYGLYDGYQSFYAFNNLILETSISDGGDLINSYVAPLQSNNWNYGKYVILSSGFYNQEENSNGSNFGLFSILNSYSIYYGGGFLTPLEIVGDPEYDDPCEALLLPTNGDTFNINNQWNTILEGEVHPPYDDYLSSSPFIGWGDTLLTHTAWVKFVAPSSGSVNISTCSNSSFPDQIAIYSATDCSNFSTYTNLAANQGFCYYGSFIPICGLNSGETYYVQIDNIYGNAGNFQISINEENATCVAKLQIINNCADILTSNVDIRYYSIFNDDIIFGDYLLAVDDLYPSGKDLHFRQTTGSKYVPANTALFITINPENSENDNNPLFSKVIFLEKNTENTLVLEGLLSESGYTPPSTVVPFDLNLIENTNQFISSENVDLMFYHGSTDSPEIDINELSTNQLPYINDLSFRQTTDYSTLPALDGYKFQASYSTFDLNITPELEANFATSQIGYFSIIVLASGFRNPTINNDGPSLGLWYAREYSRNLIPFLQNNTPCGAIELFTNSELVGNTDGATVDLEEVNPPFGSSCAEQWCDYSVDNSLWYKFVATSNSAEITTCYQETGVSDTQIAIWTATDCNDYSTFNYEAAVDDDTICNVGFYGFYKAKIQLCNLISGTTYYIQVDGSNANLVEFRIGVLPYDDCIVDGTKENTNLLNLSIYPNPTAVGQLNINFETRTSGKSVIELFDAIGNKVKSIDLGKNEAGKITETINVSDLATGLYLVNIIHNNQIISSKVQVEN
jgi:Secretion system C-terminal sorting domain